MTPSTVLIRRHHPPPQTSSFSDEKSHPIRDPQLWRLILFELESGIRNEAKLFMDSDRGFVLSPIGIESAGEVLGVPAVKDPLALRKRVMYAAKKKFGPVDTEQSLIKFMVRRCFSALGAPKPHYD